MIVIFISEISILFVDIIAFLKIEESINTVLIVDVGAKVVKKELSRN
tara:strand:+ start:2043 stop:2183 length:141 start_codon:yes stop_codon:yes gene_type:complete